MNIAPPKLTREAATVFGLTKQDLLTTSEHASVVTQTGAFAIDVEAPVWPVHLRASEPRIETFTVTIDKANVTTEPTGMDTELIDGFAGPAQVMAEHMVAALRAAGVRLGSPAWLTASVTPADQITGLAHMDDDMFAPAAGVGVVGICGNLDGPRVAIDALEVPPISRPTQVSIPEATIEAFTVSELPHHQAAADELVVLPQFGQLHAGPRLTTNAGPTTMRYLMVMRIETIPTGR